MVNIQHFKLNYLFLTQIQTEFILTIKFIEFCWGYYRASDVINKRFSNPRNNISYYYLS